MDTLGRVTRKENTYDKSNLFSKITFRYLSNTFRDGNKRHLSGDDVMKIRKEDSSTYLNQCMEKLWEKEKTKSKSKNKEPSFFKVMVRFIIPRIVMPGILAFLMISIKLFQPFCLRNIIKGLAKENNDGNNEALYWGVVLACVMVMIPQVHAYIFLSMEVAGVDLKSAVLTLIFKKALRIHQGAINQITTGKIITLISTDAQKMMEGIALCQNIWLAPLVLVATTVILWRDLGPSCMAGIGCLLLTIPLQSTFGKLFAKMRMKTVKETDRRVNTMNEIITSMQVTKMYTWEESFAKIIQQIRKKETTRITRASLLRAFNLALFASSSYIVIFATFATFYFHGDSPVTMALLFQTMAIFFIVRIELALLFPVAIQLLSESYIGTKRIQKFLLTEEMEHKFDPIETVPKVVFNNVTAKYSEDGENIISNITFNCDKNNNLIMIVGPVGCGKSSILNAILKEMYVEKGHIDVKGKIAFVAQQTWIFSSTVRQNILFGNEFDKKKYKKVIQACALETDLKLFENGDMTVVGERGVSLSGGQKARINLARALYHDADIYLLDDPLSAVDAKVGRHLFEKCINGALKDKLVILVTHQIQYLRYASSIYTMQKGTAVQSTRENIIEQHIDIGDHDSIHEETEKEKEKHDHYHLMVDDEDEFKTFAETACSTSFERSSFRYSLRKTNSTQSIDKFIIDEDELPKYEKQSKQKEEENKTKGAVSFQLYYDYFSKGLGLTRFFFIGFIIVATQAWLSMTDIYMAQWAYFEEQRYENKTSDKSYFFEKNPDNNLYILCGLIIIGFMLNCLRSMAWFVALIKCSRVQHNLMFKSILKAPIYFFDTNPVGQILNRFARDIFQMDDELPWKFFDAVQYSIVLVVIVIINAISIPYLLIIIVPLGFFFFWFRSYYMRVAREIKRLEAASRTPVYNHISASLSGLTSIRAYNKENDILDEFYSCQDYQAEGYIMFIKCVRWFCYRLDLISTCFGVCAVFSPVLAVRYTDVDAGLVGISISYVLMLPGMFQWCIRQTAEVSNLMVAVERVHAYTQLTPEEDEGNNEKLSKDWPKHGSITAENISFQYHESLPKVLDRINFSIRPDEKVGIVGRTGAGKSSLLNMLFRMGVNNGKLLIDGYDISGLKLKTLRRTISVIPQDPVLFSGSLRKNLDPFNNYSDEEIWQALEEVQMKEKICEMEGKLESAITESGSNLSVGQRQLLCLARALLKKNKILVVDEATANVDFETDKLIQATIREKFRSCTVLTVAHRLVTIMDCDKVLVLDAGRILEFDLPYNLLQIDNGIFKQLVYQNNKEEIAKLTAIAKAVFLQKHGTFDESNLKNNLHEEKTDDSLPKINIEEERSDDLLPNITIEIADESVPKINIEEDRSDDSAPKIDDSIPKINIENDEYTINFSADNKSFNDQE